ncbi:MAG: hypothetical protein JEZ05_09885 [Tenericutes bacterium]|nr:hypothetical protein [Mycoplasmatota bacterium]
MNWIMKKILKVLLILTIIITVLVVIPLVLLSKATTPPIEQYVEQSESDFYNSLNQELTALITDSNEDIIYLTIDEAFINRVIQTKLSKGNSKYLNDDFSDELAYNYTSVFGEHIGLKSIWTTIGDDQITITAGADYVTTNGKVIYQTGLEIIFDIVLSEGNQYYLKVNNIDIGKISLSNRAAYKLSNFIITTLTQKSINEIFAENLAFGTFDSEDMSFTVGELELANYLYEIDPTFSALLKVIYQEDLLILDVSDDGFDISLDIGVFRRLTSDFDEPNFVSWGTAADKAIFMADLAASAMINFGLNPFNPKIVLSESNINSLIDYTLGDDVQFEIPFTFKVDGQEIEYIFSSTNLFVRMNDNVLSIHLLMTLSKTGVSETFSMQFNLSSTVSMNASGDMILSIIEANIGEVELDNQILETLFGVFDDALFTDGTIVIKKEKLNEMFEGSYIAVNDMLVLDGELQLYYGLDN